MTGAYANVIVTEKSETISFRVTPEMRGKLQEYAEARGYSSEADALRGLLRRQLFLEEKLIDGEEFENTEDLIKRLEEIRKEIKEIDRPFWRKWFKK